MIRRSPAELKALRPVATTGDGGDAVRSWDAALMAVTPTFLPDLKFHQLVFGHTDLGKGAFSTVKYARAIEKNKTQSQWPEYAAKVINVAKIR